MKTLVINEPFIKNYCRSQRWPARTRGKAMRPPDWLAYCAAVLERDGNEVRMYDFPAEGWDREKLAEIIRGDKPGAVVLDSTTPSIHSDLRCAAVCKQNSDCKVIMVGPHATALPEEVLLAGGGGVDVVARGEYEYSVRDTVRAFGNNAGLSGVQGISFLEGNGRVVNNPARPLIEDLDELPFPAWHHLDMTKYFDGTKLYPFINVTGSRGCPHGCIFCLWPQVMHGRRCRVRSTENIIAEIAYDLEKWPQLNNGEIFFEDDSFTSDPARVREFCDSLAGAGLRINWSANSRADITDPSLLKIMKASGCRMLMAGFESGSQRMLDGMKKQACLRDMSEFAGMAKKSGIKLHGCFILGLPGETKQSMGKTLEFALSLPIDTVQFSCAAPFPGTEFEEMRGKERHSGGIEAADLEKTVDSGLKKFYLRPSYMARFMLDSRNLSDIYRKFRGAGNFLSYLVGKGANAWKNEFQ